MPTVALVAILVIAVLIIFVRTVTDGPREVSPVPPTPSGASADAGTCDVILEEAGDRKIQVIKILREATGLGLKEAKDMAEGTPGRVRSGVPREEADALVKALQEAGARARIQ